MADFVVSQQAGLPFLVVFIIISLSLFLQKKEKKIQYSYPPGPKGIPIFGNLFQLPPSYPGPQLAKWSQQYGDL
jgi:hypothetical protein